MYKICNRSNEDGTWLAPEEISHVAKLLEQYIRDYVKKIGGVSKIKLYTREECDAILDQDWDLVMDTIKKFR